MVRGFRRPPAAAQAHPRAMVRRATREVPPGPPPVGRPPVTDRSTAQAGARGCGGIVRSCDPGVEDPTVVAGVADPRARGVRASGPDWQLRARLRDRVQEPGERDAGWVRWPLRLPRRSRPPTVRPRPPVASTSRLRPPPRGFRPVLWSSTGPGALCSGEATRSPDRATGAREDRTVVGGVAYRPVTRVGDVPSPAASPA